MHTFYGIRSTDSLISVSSRMPVDVTANLKTVQTVDFRIVHNIYIHRGVGVCVGGAPVIAHFRGHWCVFL